MFSSNSKGANISVLLLMPLPKIINPSGVAAVQESSAGENFKSRHSI